MVAVRMVGPATLARPGPDTATLEVTVLSKRTTEIAWAAGLFEGEGCIGVYPQVNGTQGLVIVVRLCSTDGDVVDRFAAIVGCGKIRRDTQQKRRHLGGGAEHWKPLDEWALYEAAKVRELLEAFMPWFGKRRLAKAVEVLDAIAHVRPHGYKKTHCPQGHPLSGENLVLEPYTRQGVQKVTRRCKECRRSQDRERMRLKRARLAAERAEAQVL